MTRDRFDTPPPAVMRGPAARTGPRRRRRLDRLSVRVAVAAAMSALVALAVVGSIMNLRALSSAAFMLHRAETSYRQLSAYRQLSTDALEYVLARNDPHADRPRREPIERHVAELDDMIRNEVKLLRENGDDETNAVEIDRLGQIHSLMEAMFAADAPSPTTRAGAAERTPSEREPADAIYRRSLKPLLATAIEGEQTEILSVEQVMRELQARMRWLGPLALLFQLAVVCLVLLLVKRALLDPMSRLVFDIKAIGGGTLAHRALVPRHDEFGLLAQHINRMARNLESGRRSLVALNDGLEATVTERTSALRQRNEELREIDDSRRRFFADVSHELRTPLTAIVGEAEVTLRSAKPTPDVVRETLTAVLANATFLGRRIDDLLALSRSSDGTLEIASDIVDLNVVAAEATGQIRSLAKVNGVEVRFDPLDEPLQVRGDHVRLRQSLMILLDNAVKFSASGQTVDIELARHDTAAELAVIDRGRGIAEAELPLVFERYYQTEVGRKMGGTGLGLSIARRIIEAHGGMIAAQRSKAGGTTIRMRFDVVSNRS